MGLVHVTVTLKKPGAASGFEGLFLVDTGATDSEPLLGVTALESVGISVDPANQTPKRLPAVPLK